jgi:hypothetical protein
LNLDCGDKGCAVSPLFPPKADLPEAEKAAPSRRTSAVADGYGGTRQRCCARRKTRIQKIRPGNPERIVEEKSAEV